MRQTDFNNQSTFSFSQSLQEDYHQSNQSFYCKNGKESFQLCINSKCKSQHPYCCQERLCQCRKKEHFGCQKGQIQYLINKIKERQTERVTMRTRVDQIFDELINQLSQLKQNILIKLQENLVHPQIQKAQKQLISSTNLFKSTQKVQSKYIKQKQTQEYLLTSSGTSMVWQSLHKIATQCQEKKVQNQITQLIEKFYEKQFQSMSSFQKKFDKLLGLKSIERNRKITSLLTQNKSSRVTIGDQIVNFYSPECVDCSKQLAYPFYWCKWEDEQNVFKCRQCVQSLGINHNNLYQKPYKYNKNCILLFEQPSYLNVQKMGQNIQPTLTSQIIDHSYRCNGCRRLTKSKYDPRYLCLECDLPKGDYIDICPECLQLMLQKDRDVLLRLHEKKHQENHALLRIRYNVQGYYNF